MENSPANSTVTELRVTGMTCNNCARHVTEAIQSVSNVRSASVSLKKKSATVRWNGHAKNVADVLAAIAGAGFAAKEASAETPGDESNQCRWQWNLILGLAVTVGLMVGEWVFGLMMTGWFRWLSFFLAAIVQVFCGAQFYSGAWRQLKVGSSNMDTLVALGSTTAFGFSCWVLFGGAGGHVYFMEAAAIISLISFGHWIEARVSDKASSALKSLLNLAPQTARRISLHPKPLPEGEGTSATGLLKYTTTGSDPTLERVLPLPRAEGRGEGNLNLKTLEFSKTEIGNRKSEIEEEVLVSELKIGDRIALRPGDRVPVDGVALEGESAVDEAMLTGESVPADKKTGDELFAGTVNVNGRLVMRVTATGEATALAHIIAAVQRAQTSRADIQRIGDRISNVFVPVIVVIALTVGIFWAFHSGAEKAFVIASGILIVACPCAMGLATPAAIMASANTAARRGILIRDGVALEKAGRITAIVLDKTGTLTSGELMMTGPWVPDESKESIQQAQEIAGALAHPSNHPVSKVLAWLSTGNVKLDNWKEVPGSGVQADLASDGLNKTVVRLGSFSWFQSFDIQLPERQELIKKWISDGATLVGLSKGNAIVGVFALRDFLKPNSAKVVWQLQVQQLKTYLLTGDNAVTATAIAKQVGIAAENVFAEVRPEQKAEFVKKLQLAGERVAFVGDGINDAPALTQADLGIAVSRASDVAREAADIILLRSEIEALPEALGLARATLRTIKQNLFWAFFYNALGVPLAAMGFISPIFCAAAMGVSDLIVIGNALRLLRWRK